MNCYLSFFYLNNVCISLKVTLFLFWGIEQCCLQSPHCFSCPHAVYSDMVSFELEGILSYYILKAHKQQLCFLKTQSVQVLDNPHELYLSVEFFYNIRIFSNVTFMIIGENSGF